MAVTKYRSAELLIERGEGAGSGRVSQQQTTTEADTARTGEHHDDLHYCLKDRSGVSRSRQVSLLEAKTRAWVSVNRIQKSKKEVSAAFASGHLCDDEDQSTVTSSSPSSASTLTAKAGEYQPLPVSLGVGAPLRGNE